MEQPLSINSLFAIPKKCAYGDGPNGVYYLVFLFYWQHRLPTRTARAHGPGRTGGQTGGPGQTDCRMAGPGQKDSSGGRAALGWSRWTGVLSESAGLTRT